MLAMNYRGPYRVRAEQKSTPYIEHPCDAIVRVNRACICGSDLHLYHGLVPDTRIGTTVVNHVDYRLAFVKKFAQCEVVNFKEVKSMALHIKKMTDWMSADVCIDAVGCEAAGNCRATTLIRQPSRRKPLRFSSPLTGRRSRPSLERRSRLRA